MGFGPVAYTGRSKRGFGPSSPTSGRFSAVLRDLGQYLSEGEGRTFESCRVRQLNQDFSRSPQAPKTRSGQHRGNKPFASREQKTARRHVPAGGICSGSKTPPLADGAPLIQGPGWPLDRRQSCQGWGRGLESLRPLQIFQEVTAKQLTGVWVARRFGGLMGFHLGAAERSGHAAARLSVGKRPASSNCSSSRSIRQVIPITL